MVGRTLRLGSKAEVALLERDPRCKVMPLDPDTGEHKPEVLRKVVLAHGACAGAYAAVLAEGILFEGAPVEVID